MFFSFSVGKYPALQQKYHFIVRVLFNFFVFTIMFKHLQPVISVCQKNNNETKR